MGMMKAVLRKTAAIAGGFSLATLAGMAMAHATPGNYDGYGMGHMWGGGWGMIFGPIFMIVVLVVIVAAVAMVLRWIFGSTDGSSGQPERNDGRSDDAALRILRERFARGEIDREEYEERRRALES